jgi:hypothetical protein
MAPPPLTDTQRRVDETLQQYLAKWNSLNESQRNAPDGMGLKSRIVNLIKRRNGPDAAKEVTARLDKRGVCSPSEMQWLDENHPRIDGPTSPPAPTPEPATALAPDRHDTSSAAYKAAPGDERKWLPAGAKLPPLIKKDRDALNAADAAIEEINTSLFTVDPALAWHPAGASLPVTGVNISTLGGTYELAKELLPQLKEKIDSLCASFGTASEQLIDKQYERMKGPLKILSDAADTSQGLHGMIARSGTAINNAFHHQLRGSDLAARTAIGHAVNTIIDRAQVESHANLGRSDPRSMISRGEFTRLLSTLQTSPPAPTVDGEVTKVRQVTAAIGAPETVPRENASAAALHTNDKSSKHRTESPRAARGGGTPPGEPRGGGGTAASGLAAANSGNDLARLLSTLGNGGLPPTTIPQQVAQTAQQAARPLADVTQKAANMPDELLNKLRNDKPDNQRLYAADTTVAEAAGRDRNAATSKTFTMPGSAPPDKLGTVGANARPHQLDAIGKPVDRDHDGKVDKDAVPLARKTIKPFDLTVDANGTNRHVTGIRDPRLGEMMLNMADASEDNPVSVLDAAKASGMNIESLGNGRDADDARVGDAVIGDEKSGMYLGSGEVLTCTGQIERLDDVLGEDGFVSEVLVPELPDDVPSPANHDDVQVAQHPPPVDAPPPNQQPAPKPQPATADPAEQVAVMTPLSAPTAPNTGGGPRQVPYQGHALG